MRSVSPGIIGGLLIASLALVASNATGQQRAGASNADAKTLENPVRPIAESIEAGAKTYKKYCQFCHGADGGGNGPFAPKDTNPPNLTDATWDRGSTDGEIYTDIRDGIGPAFTMKGLAGKLPETEIWNLVNYLRSIGPKAPAGATR